MDDDELIIDMHRLKTQSGRVTITRAEYSWPFARLIYELDGKRMKYGLRLDVGKRAILDSVGDPELDAEVKASAVTILDAMIDEIERMEQAKAARPGVARKHVNGRVKKAKKQPT